MNMLQQQLKGKVAVVTGAGGTLCSEMAIHLAAQGAQVALLGRSLDKLHQVEQQILEVGGQAMSVSIDVTNETQVAAARMKILEQFGNCHILINGAGGNQPNAVTTHNKFEADELSEIPSSRGFFNLSMPQFQQVIEINTMGTVIPCYVFGRDMAANQQGCIINIASMNSYRPLSRVGAYAMAKASIANFTQWLAAYLAPANVRVNAIAPGFFLNDRSRKLLLTPDGYSERGSSIVRQTPMKRFGEASELLGCMDWLIDDKAAAFVTGITIPIDGGFLADSGV